MFKKFLRWFTIDMVSTIFLGLMTGFTVYFGIKGFTVPVGLLAMCDAFIFRGIIWQGMYVDRISVLSDKIVELGGEVPPLK
jgi:hypothetical protein